MMKNLILSSEILKKVALLLLFIGFSALSFAQTKTITGTVVDEKGEALVAVSVFVQGTRLGNYTDAKGNYTLNNVPENAILVFSSIGYSTQTIAAGDRSIINVTLVEDAIALEEAVITAEFGLKRVARSVGSSVQNVKAEEIVESGRDNFITALQSRIAGISVTSSGGTPGSSTNVVLRSVTSISGSNQPLYVIDGVPMNNSTFDPLGIAGPELFSARSLDFATMGNDINPEDIESMSVLKGAAASALYGSDASNGVIVITTKKGSSGRGKVQYATSLRFDNAYGYPEIQTKYANGRYGTTNYYFTSRYGDLYPEGMKLYDNFQALLRTGKTTTHSFSVDGGNEKFTLRASGKYLDQTGIVKGTDYTRLNMSISGKAEVTKWLQIDGSMTYAETTNNKVEKGNYGPMPKTFNWPSVDDMSVYLDADGKHMRKPNYYTDGDLINPLFAINKNKLYDENQSFTASYSLTLRPIASWYVIAKAGINANFYSYEAGIHPYSAANNDGKGTYSVVNGRTLYPTITLLTGYNLQINDFELGAQFGYNQLERTTHSLSSYGTNFMVIDFMGLNNCDSGTFETKTQNTTKRIQALFGQFEASYKNMAFLTLRGRNDWASTLPKENRSFFYPALELSFIASELSLLKDNSTINYLKLRASVAQVGKAPEPLAIYPALQSTAIADVSDGSFGGGYRYGYTGPNTALKPEMTTEYEAGFEARLLNNRLNLDFSAYTRTCEDQYVTAFRLSYATGFVLNNMNVGTFKAWGWDFHADGDIIKTKTITWNFGLNMSKAKSKVTYLPDNVSEYYSAYTFGNVPGTRNGVKVGYSVTTITGTAMLRNKNGDVIINPGTGLPMVSDQYTVIGDREPKLRYNFTTSLRYKDFRLTAAFAGRWKTTVINGTKRSMLVNGLSWESVEFREMNPYVFKGVLNDDFVNSDNPTVNTIAHTYGMGTGGTVYAGTPEDWIEDGINYIRLEELRLSYNVPRQWLQKMFKGTVSQATVYVAGNDLLTFTNYSGIDAVGNTASAALGGSGGVGIDTYSIPSPRAITIGFSVTF
ncbi:MAG: SusC/RagA family TonB-linked outer membrane protein [Prevotellaceae bacterium]|jgi:TonB-linked SusC/RagA family outer membrane protein|nr:SusC/RagA family TonB-linked outer membrane protein [Prevotellaceae bacterium]